MANVIRGPFRKGLDISYRKGLIFSFVLGFAIRLIPEILSYPYPIGFDTLYYAARIKSGMVWFHWTSVFSMWLLDAILISVQQIIGTNPFLLLKLTAPLLYALNVCGVYYFSRKALCWNVSKALTAAFFFTFQLTALRLSWDLYRNMLGAALLLFTLPLVQDIKTKKKFALFALLSVSIVFAHQLVSIVLFIIILSLFMNNLLKGERTRAFKILVAALPAFIILVTSLSFPLLGVEKNVIDTCQPPSRPGGIHFMVDYLNISDTLHACMHYVTYWDIVASVFSLFSVLYLLCLPLVLVGFFRDKVLDSWTLLLLVASFDTLITPFFALDYWNRWMFMLVYPFTFYAVNGVEKVLESGGKRVSSNLKWMGWVKVSRRTTFGILFVTVVFGSLFIAVPPFFDRFGVFFIPVANSFIPSTMLYNTVPLRDVKGTVDAIEWLNEHMDNVSSVLVHYAFLQWTNLYLNEKHVIVYYENDVEKALTVALERGFDHIYLIWWNENYLTWQDETFGWYGLTMPKYFISITSSDRISVFKYSTNHKGA